MHIIIYLPTYLPYLSCSLVSRINRIVLHVIFNAFTVDTTRIKPFSKYVCNEQIFDSSPFIKKNIFLKVVLLKLVAHSFTLLLAPFVSELVNYSRQSESWKMLENGKMAVFEGKCRRFRKSSECLESHYAWNNWPIWTQNVPKEP